jgi:hypothetical protein
MSYDSAEAMELKESHGLNSLCVHDETLWTVQCRLIYYYVVENHFPVRVIRQFGREQPIRPHGSSTSFELHR